ncbi:MAG: hypothetical protein ABIO73_02215 [Polaromonas sp.]
MPPFPWWPLRAVQLWLGADGLRMGAAMPFCSMLITLALLVWIYFSSAMLLLSAGCARALQERGRPGAIICVSKPAVPGGPPCDGLI